MKPKKKKSASIIIAESMYGTRTPVRIGKQRRFDRPRKNSRRRKRFTEHIPADLP